MEVHRLSGSIEDVSHVFCALIIVGKEVVESKSKSSVRRGGILLDEEEDDDDDDDDIIYCFCLYISF